MVLTLNNQRTRRLVALLAASLWLGLAPAHSASSQSGPGRRVPAPSEVPIPQPVTRGFASPADTTLVGLGREFMKIAARTGGAVGISILHLETGQRISLRGGERFPMASVYKLPIALELMNRISCDELSLDDVVPIGSADLRSGSGWIRHHRSRTATLTVHELLRAMLQDSDNTASDRLLRMAGGPDAVTQRLLALGITEVRVDRSEASMSLDYGGVVDAAPESTWTLAELARMKGQVPESQRNESAAAFLSDPRDTATPDAMVDLLACLWRGCALGPDETSRLIEILERTRTGPGRLRGKLPPETPVAHKTGTWSTTNGVTAAVNDVGLISLPGGAGTLAIAVFVKASNRSPHRIERGIASISRAAYDQWTEDVPQLPAP